MADTHIKAEDITILPPEIETKISNEISTIRVEANVTEELIKNLREQYGSMTINGQADKEGYLNLQTARKVIKNLRVAAEKKFDQGREQAVAVAQMWLDNKKTVVAELKSIEEPLHKLEKEYELEKDRLKELERARIEQQGLKRMTEMIRFGAQLQGPYWVLGEVQYEAALVKEADEEFFKDIRAEFQAQFEVNDAARIKKEEDDAAAALLLKDQQDDIARQQKELKEAQDKLATQLKEARVRSRESFLEGLGMTKNDAGHYIYADQVVWGSHLGEKDEIEWGVTATLVSDAIFKIKDADKERERVRNVFSSRLPLLKEWSSNGHYVYAKGKTWGDVATIVDMPEDEFEKLISENDAYLKDRDNEKERIRLQDIEDTKILATGKSRRSMLATVNGSFPGTDQELGAITDGQWSVGYETAKSAFDKEKKRIADEKEQERKDGLGDKAAYEEFLVQLRAIKVPSFKSGQYRALGKIIKEKMEIIESLQIAK